MYKPDNENLQKLWLLEPNQWNIPEIKAESELPLEDIYFVGFNHCKSLTRKNEINYGVHFFLDDYQFNRLWNQPDKYVELLKRFLVVLAPDFSMYLDYPKAIQTINTIKNIGWHDIGKRMESW